MDNELVKVAEESGLEKSQSEIILSKFTTFFEQAKQWEVKAKLIKITDPSQTQEMAQAREIRLELKDIRVSAEKVRKAEKEHYLRYGRAIDGIGNVIKALIEPLEEYLEQQEKFVEIMVAAEKEKVNQQRIAQLSPYVPDVSIYNLKEMSQAGFDDLLNLSKVAKETIATSEKKAAEEHMARLEAEKAEQARVKEENEKLRKEQLIKNAELAIEREAKEALEKQAKERAEADARAKQEAEAKIKLEAEKAEKEKERLASLSDREKVNAFADLLASIKFPEVSSKEYQWVLKRAQSELSEIVANLKN